MKPHLVYKSLVILVVTFTRSDTGNFLDGVVRATWEGIVRTARGRGWGGRGGWKGGRYCESSWRRKI